MHVWGRFGSGDRWIMIRVGSISIVLIVGKRKTDIGTRALDSSAGTTRLPDND